MQRVFTTTCVLLTLSAGASAATIQVPADHTSIQDAIDAATHGDEIIVGPGTYTEQIDYFGKDLIVRSSDGAAVTTIDANGPGNAVRAAAFEPDTARLEGFTITGGTGVEEIVDGANVLVGGGLYLGSALHVVDCIVTANTATHGAGVFVVGTGNPTLENTAFTNNIATENGGALYCGVDTDTTIIDCAFTGNSADSGGATFHLGYNDSIYQCVFTKNTASTYGGAMYLDQHFTNGGSASDFIANHAGFAGGAIYSDGSFFIGSSTFTGNTSDWIGGAFAAVKTAGPLSCEFFDNTAALSGGAIIAGHSLVDDTIFDGNSAQSGGAIYTNSIYMRDSVLNENSASISGGALHALTPESSLPFYVTGTTFTGNTAGDGGAVYEIPGEPGAFMHWVNNTFDGNIATGSGGAMYLQGVASEYSNCLFINNEAGVEGGAVLSADGTPWFNHCTITENTAIAASGVSCIGNSFAFMTNSICWGNAVGELSGGIDVMESNIRFGWAGPGNIDVDPQFDAEYGLSQGSPCINAGDAFLRHMDRSDINGNSNWDEPMPLDILERDRIFGFETDMGAFEFTPCNADIDGNGSVGINDLLLLVAAWGHCPGCPEDIDDSDFVDAVDLLILLAAWGDCP